MKTVLMSLLMLMSGPAFANSVICKVKGMHCDGCKEMVEGKVCDEAKYSKCEVRIADANKKLGEIKLSTKDPKAKVDQKALSAVIEDSGYKLQKCKKI